MTGPGGKSGAASLRLAADLDVMWPDLPVLDRIEAAGAAGFEGIALSAPYDMPAKELQRAALRAGVTLVRIATPPPNYTGGDRGFAARVGGAARFEHDLRRATRYCTVLQVPMLQVLAGDGQSVEAKDALRSNLAQAAGTAPSWMQLVIGSEPGESAALADTDACIALLEAIDTRRLAAQLPCALDSASQARVSQVIQTFGPRIAALTLVTEPQAGSALQLDAFADAVQAAGFKGWLIACYPAQGPTDETLGWMRPART